MRLVTECVALTIALIALAQPALALNYLNCSTRKVTMISAPSGDTSSTREEEVAFVIDEAAKTLTFSDNRPLTVTRLDEYWISANRDDVFYEFNRQDGSLTYASSTTEDGVTTTIVGSGQCAISPAPMLWRPYSGHSTEKLLACRALPWTPHILCGAGGPRMR